MNLAAYAAWGYPPEYDPTATAEDLGLAYPTTGTRPDAEAEASGEAKPHLGDSAIFSEAAIAAFKEAAIEPIKNGTFSLDGLQRRINTVRTEINQVWNSAMSDSEKDRQISAKKNEIALLQAGQYTFAKAGFPLSI
ncbi:hypothetical protein [Pseudodesulfovibrio sp.]|uniref:hypothetical protein n=1 Tax=unclassified Pseudodesulfovibrio TaxID=2661612 RepID=UPI003B0058B7